MSKLEHRRNRPGEALPRDRSEEEDALLRYVESDPSSRPSSSGDQSPLSVRRRRRSQSEMGIHERLDRDRKHAFAFDVVDDPTTSTSVTSSVADADGTVIYGTSSLADHYKPIEAFEGAHRWDPEFQWGASEEQRLVRKLDWKICSWVCFMFFALQLDRGNIVQANSDNLLGDLGLNTNDYNTGQTIFFVCFIVAELPSQVISKWIGPDNWIPMQMVAWSFVAAFQAFLNGRTSFFVCRALLGFFEGGYIPSTILYLSYFYTGAELPVRCSWFWTAYQFTYIVSAFMAYGILHMQGILGLEGWRWLFAIEGLLTGLIGIASYFYLPPSPTQTASRFRGQNGWFSLHEEKIMVNRILRDDPSKGDMHNRQALTWAMLWSCLKDFDMWPIYLLGLSWMLPQIPPNSYLTLLLKSEGFGTFTTNLLCIPAYCIFIVNLLFWTWVSEKVNDRFLVGTVSQLWCIAPLIGLEILPDSNVWGRYTCIILLVGYPYVHAIVVAMTSRNAGSVRTRTVASAIYNMCVQASNVIGSNIYRDDDKPIYHRGNGVLLGICVYNIVLFVFSKFYYVWRNKRRAAVWDAMSIREKKEYLTTTKDEGNRRLDFRFAH